MRDCVRLLQTIISQNHQTSDLRIFLKLSVETKNIYRIIRAVGLLSSTDAEADELRRYAVLGLIYSNDYNLLVQMAQQWNVV